MAWAALFASNVSAGRIFFKYWFPVILWMAAIFIGSTDILAGRHTSHFLAPLIHWFIPSISDALSERIQFIIRKCGHVSEYAVLAFLLWRALCREMRSGALVLWPQTLCALALATIYAATDEYHQSFISTRFASPLDVLIDGCGALLALVMIGLIRARRIYKESL